MRVYRKELNRLKSAKTLVKRNFAYFGVNKKQEITRLLYEISKRDDMPPSGILDKSNLTDYSLLKKYLLKKRYPHSSSKSMDFRPYFPKLEFSPSEPLEIKKKEFYPGKIFVDKAASAGSLARQFKESFPKASFTEIKSLKDYFCGQRNRGIEDYNKRQKSVFIVKEDYDFFKSCPCTKGAIGCGYHVFNLGFGCIYECTYCFLQEYTNTPGIILPANIERFFDIFSKYKKSGMRIGTGEFSDSLALDDFTGYSLQMIDFFRKYKNVTFEFKTKSSKIGNLLRSNHSGNVVVSWSINPQELIKENEFYCASLKERLDAAAKCIEAGYRVGFHFDPVIYFSGWEKEYRALIKELFEKIKPKDIAWISIGTFRFSPGLKQVIERRFPANRILDEELILGFDDKLRYAFDIRFEVYDKIIKMLSRHSQKLKLYLCMEEVLMWSKLRLKMPKFP